MDFGVFLFMYFPFFIWPILVVWLAKNLLIVNNQKSDLIKLLGKYQWSFSVVFGWVMFFVIGSMMGPAALILMFQMIWTLGITFVWVVVRLVSFLLKEQRKIR